MVQFAHGKVLQLTYNLSAAVKSYRLVFILRMINAQAARGKGIFI